MTSRVLFNAPTRTRRFAGAGFVAGLMPAGLVTVATAPGAREVEVRHRASRVVVARTFSATNGTYRIDGLDPAQQFDVIGRDWSGTYNDVIVSRVRPRAY